MKLRIKPRRVRPPRIRVVRNLSVMNVAVTLGASMLCAVVGLVSFTMFGWEVGAAVGELPMFPFVTGFFAQRELWLMVAMLSGLLAALAGSLAGEFSGSVVVKSDDAMRTSLQDAGEARQLLN